MKRIVAFFMAIVIGGSCFAGFSVSATNFNNSLPGLKGLSGTWEETEEGLYSSGAGDNFALSIEKATNFSLEADVTFQEHKGAASLIFLATDNPAAESYFANIDLNAGNARIYRFGGGTLGEYFLPTSLKQKDAFHLRVEVVGKDCNYYIDEKLVISCQLPAKQENSTGYLGLLTFDTSVVYQNVRHEILEENQEPPVTVDPDTLYREEHRPQFHFSPLKNWMNDPNGLVYDPSNGTWHLFYQYNPYGMSIGNQVWGHAESTDLVNWTQIDEIAIDQDDGLGAIFSGSVVVDEKNTSGFFGDNKKGESKLVAIYTADGGDTTHGVEKQCIAYSKDHGHTWIKYTGNPVLPNDNNVWGRDFRDPKVFWYDGQWMMVIAGGRARLFTSPDLIHWTFAGDLGMDSECPCLYPLPVDGDSNNIKWVYVASGRWYKIGSLKKEGKEYKFVPETEALPYNGGSEVYATQNFYNDGSGKNRVISISWMQDHSASQLEDKGWNGVMTLPYEQQIRTVNGQLRLTSYPVEEVDSLRGVDLYSGADQEITTKTGNVLSGIAVANFEIVATIAVEDATQFGFSLRKGIGEQIKVTYDVGKKQLSLYRSNGGILTQSLSPNADGTITLRILVDNSIVEVFGNSGEAAISALCFPSKESVGMEFFTKGNVTVKEMQVYNLKSIWHKSEYNFVPEGIYFSMEQEDVELGKEFVVEAVAVEEDGSTSFIEWEFVQTGDVKVISEMVNSLKLEAINEGSVVIRAKANGKTKDLKFIVKKYNFSTNLTGWYGYSGAWKKDDWGYGTDTGVGGGDAFAFSDATISENFVYEAQAKPQKSGGCAGLVFGVTNPSAPFSGTWYGANIDTTGDGTAAAKLFCNRNGQEVWRVTTAIPKAEDNMYSLEVTVDDGVISYWINDVLVGEREDDTYVAGTVGLVAFNGGAYFNAVKVQTDEEDTGNSQTTSTPTIGKTPALFQCGTTTPDGNGLLFAILAVILVVFAAGGIGIGIYLKKKKK